MLNLIQKCYINRLPRNSNILIMSNSIENNRTTQKKSPPTALIPEKAKITNYIQDARMVDLLKKKGITKLFPIQYETFEYIHQGLDVVAKDRTGSGKTLAFALPIITRMRKQSKFSGWPFPKLLIMLPTRELAIQVKDEIASLCLNCKDDFIVTAIYGGAAIQDQRAALRKGVDIIVGTPGRVVDFMDRGEIQLNFIEVVCLDEADQMLNIGFKQKIEAIFRAISAVRKQRVQWLMFSATIPAWIWKISNMYLANSAKYIDMIQNESIQTSQTVGHYCIYAEEEKEQYIEPIMNYFLGNKKGKAIIFCETKRQVDRIGSCSLLSRSVAMLHGDYCQYEREKIFNDFKRGGLSCLIATNVAARGLDFPEIDLIVQMQPPTTTDTYIHRSGRTGRVGKSGICITLYNDFEIKLMEKIEYEAKIRFQHIQSNQLWPPLTNNQPYLEDRSLKYDVRGESEIKQFKKVTSNRVYEEEMQEM